MKAYFKEASFIETNSTYISSTSHRLLNLGLLDFEKKFQAILNDKEAIFKSQHSAQIDAVSHTKFYHNVWVKAQALKRELEAVEL